jgi:outer membrane protein assembly factor BamB
MNRFASSSRHGLLLAASVLLVTLGACSSTSVKSDKPMPLLAINTTLQVDKVWSAGVGGEPKFRLALSAARAADTVYLAGPSGVVEALVAQSGKVRWKTNLKLRLSAGPGVGEGLVAVGGPEGDVIVLDASTGKERWRARVGSEILAAPAIGGDAVVVRTVDGKLHALEARDGKPRWMVDQQLPRLTLRGNAPPQIVGSTVIAGFDNGRLMAITLAGGSTLWDVAVGQSHGSSELQRLIDIDSSTAVDGDDLFTVSYQGRVARIARETGQLLWSHDLSSYRGLVLGSDALFVATTEGQIVKLDRSTGAELWKQDLLLRRQLSAPTLLGDYLLVADYKGVVHWLNASDGRFVARSSAGYRVSMPPVAAGDLALVTNDKGVVSAFRVRGTLPSRSKTTPSVVPAPTAQPADSAKSGS